MKYVLVIKEEASSEIKNAFSWYEERKKGLGYEFINILEEYFERITKNPLLYPIGSGNEHVAVMKKFPYKIVYSLENQDVVVYAVFHSSRNPDDLKR